MNSKRTFIITPVVEYLDKNERSWWKHKNKTDLKQKD